MNILAQPENQNIANIALFLDNGMGRDLDDLKGAIEDSGLPFCSVGSPDHLEVIISELKPKYIFSCANDDTLESLERFAGNIRPVADQPSGDTIFLSSENDGITQILLIEPITGDKKFYEAEFSSNKIESSGKRGLKLCKESLSLEIGSESIKFTRAEFLILEHLVQREGHVTRKEQLVEIALGRQAHPQDRSVDVHICRIRRKLASALGKNTISSIRGSGYSFFSAGL